MALDPALIAAFAAAIAPKTKSGSNITQSDVDPFQQLIISQMMGQPSMKPVDEEMIRRAEAPQWTAISSYADYTEDDIEPMIQQWILSGLPLAQVVKNIKVELEAQGNATKDNKKAANDLADTLYKEFVNSNNKIQEAKTKSFENSPYTKMGVSDPSDYQNISEQDAVGLYPDMFAKMSFDSKYSPMAKPLNPKNRELLEGETRQGFFKQKSTSGFDKFMDVALPASVVGGPLVFGGAMLIDMLNHARNKGKVFKDGKEVKAGEYEPATLADKQWLAIQRSAQGLNPIAEKPGIPKTGDPSWDARVDRQNKTSSELLRLRNERRAATPVSLDNEGTRAQNTFRESQKMADMAGLARVMTRDQNAYSKDNAAKKSSDDLLKRLVLTKVMDNPKLFMNPEVQKILGA